MPKTNFSRPHISDVHFSTSIKTLTLSKISLVNSFPTKATNEIK